MSGDTDASSRLALDPMRRAIAGGVAGTVVMTVVLLIGEAEARFQLGLSSSIARWAGVPTFPVLGLLVFLGAGMFLWPLVFVAVGDHLARLPGGEDPAIRGMLFSIPLFCLYLVLAAPFSYGIVLVLHVGFVLFAHLLYGFTLGAVYHSLS